MARGDAQVEDTDGQFVISIKEMLEKVPPLPSEPSIYKIPYTFRCLNEEAFMPKIVYIGPLHHGKEELHAMETHKKRYLNDFLQQNLEISLEEYFERLKGEEERVRNCYSESISLTSNEFVKIMLLDGCFIVELFLKYVNPQLRNKDDPLFQNSYFADNIRLDMLLLENQLPFFLLEYLFNLVNGPDKKYTKHSFLELTLDNFEYQLRMGQDDLLRKSSYKVKHFMDLFLYCYLPTEPRMPHKGEGYIVLIPSATELHGAGVKFKKGTGNCFADCKFANGVLEIPTLLVDDTTECIFRNLIAMEQCRPGNTANYFTDYILLLDCLINTPSDVALLRDYGIIHNWMGDNEDVSQLFNKLCKGTMVDSKKFYYRRLFEDVNDYYNIRWHVWKAKLKRDYFNNPWAILSLIAAVILLICTFIQTVASLL